MFLDDEVAFDGKDTAAFAQVQQLDQVRVDVQLRAILTQAAGDPEAQSLAAVGQPERRIETGRDEPSFASRAAVSDRGHAVMLGRTTPEWS